MATTSASTKASVNLSKVSPAGLALTLPNCMKQLRADLGAQAPALVTLKRWSASGRLDAAKVKGEGIRPLYAYKNVLSLARTAETKAKRSTYPAPQRVQSAALDIPPPFPVELARLNSPNTDQPPADAGQIAKGVIEELQPLVARLVNEAVAATQKPLLDAIGSLEAARRSLMLKYDSQVENLRTKNEELTSELRRLKSDSMDQTRANALLSRVIDRLDRLQPSNQN